MKYLENVYPDFMSVVMTDSDWKWGHTYPYLYTGIIFKTALSKLDNVRKSQQRVDLKVTDYQTETTDICRS